MVPLALFYSYFNGYDICHFEDDCLHSSIKLVGDLRKPTLLEFRIPKRGRYYFTVHQVNARAFKDAASSRRSPEYAYSLLTLCLAKKTKDEKCPFLEVGMLKRAGKEMWVCVDCEVGEYVAYVGAPSPDRDALEAEHQPVRLQRLRPGQRRPQARLESGPARRLRLRPAAAEVPDQRRGAPSHQRRPLQVRAQLQRLRLLLLREPREDSDLPHRRAADCAADELQLQ